LEPFYIMVFAAGLAVAGLFFHVLGLFSRLLRPRRVLGYQRRDDFLSDQERLCLGTVEEAVGGNYRVFPRVAAGTVLTGDRSFGRRRRRAAVATLSGRVLDFLVCSAADAHPLCAVLAAPAEASRRRRREAALLRAACADAGLPLVELTLADGYELTAVRRELLDAIESAEVRIAPTPEPMAADEESLLAELAAAMQEPDGRVPTGRVRR